MGICIYMDRFTCFIHSIHHTTCTSPVAKRDHHGYAAAFGIDHIKLVARGCAVGNAADQKNIACTATEEPQ